MNQVNIEVGFDTTNFNREKMVLCLEQFGYSKEETEPMSTQELLVAYVDSQINSGIDFYELTGIVMDTIKVGE